jgi:hypothetical protein
MAAAYIFFRTLPIHDQKPLLDPLLGPLLPNSIDTSQFLFFDQPGKQSQDLGGGGFEGTVCVL